MLSGVSHTLACPAPPRSGSLSPWPGSRDLARAWPVHAVIVDNLGTTWMHTEQDAAAAASGARPARPRQHRAHDSNHFPQDGGIVGWDRLVCRVVRHQPDVAI